MNIKFKKLTLIVFGLTTLIGSASLLPVIEREIFITYTDRLSMSKSDYMWGNKIYKGESQIAKFFGALELPYYENIGNTHRLTSHIREYEKKETERLLSLMEFEEALSFINDGSIDKYDKDISHLFQKYEFIKYVYDNDNDNHLLVKACIDSNNFNCLSDIGQKHQLSAQRKYSIAKKYYSFIERNNADLNYFQKSFLYLSEKNPIYEDSVAINYSYRKNCASCISTQKVKFEYDQSKYPKYCHMKAREIKGVKKIRSLLLWVGFEEKKTYMHDIFLLDVGVSSSGNFAMLGAGETTEIILSPPHVRWTATRDNIRKTGNGLLKAKLACAVSWSNSKYNQLVDNNNNDAMKYVEIVKKVGLISHGAINAAYLAVHLTENKEEVLSLIDKYSTRFSDEIASQADKLSASIDKDYSRTNPLANAFADTISSICGDGRCDDIDDPKHEESKNTCTTVMVLSGKSSGEASGSCFLETKYSLASWKCKHDYMANKGKSYGEASGSCWFESKRYE